MRLRLQPCALMWIFVWGACPVLAVDPVPKVYTTPEAAAADPDFALQGEYLGANVGVQIVAQGKGEFLAVVYRGGLPGAGWNGTEKQETDEDSAGVRGLIKDLALRKVERQSPTLEAQALPGAVVLFDGTPETFKKHWQPDAKLDKELLQQGSTSIDTFNDFTLHMEFRLPYMPLARGQGRGNSGVYCQGRYETQVLDSFGLAGTDRECGGLYEVKAPDLNMCLPPLTWQTYDIEFTAARWGADGKRTSNARLTVMLNGVVIHQDVVMPGITRSAPVKEEPGPGPIYLQDHGNPVRYRNIWVMPRNAEQEARRPLVPAFERFYTSTGTDPAVGGRFLLGELNCVACHHADQGLASHLTQRPAPILDDVGKRVYPEYLLKYLVDPHGTKPGTLMPDLLEAFSPAERQAAALALTNFLVSTGTVPQLSADLQASQRGQKLFKEVGCLACHAAHDDPKTFSKTVVPLGDLTEKYSIASLAAFLQDPHKARPAGRMPNLIQENKEAIDLASYLIGNVEYKPRNPNLRFSAYHGSWNKVPKFEDLKPVKQGETAGFDLAPAGRNNDFGMRFEGFLKIENDGDYTFHLGSDDGSLLFIDGKKVADSDGVHPHTVHSGTARLTKGLHPFRVDYTQGGGEATLTLEYEGAGLPRQDINHALSLTEKGPDAKPAKEEGPSSSIRPWWRRGARFFTSLGCANCHQLKHNGEPLKSLVIAPDLKQLKAGQGCLAENATLPAVAKTTRARRLMCWMSRRRPRPRFRSSI